MGLLRGVSALALVLGLVAVPASAQSVADFYRGKTIQVIVPTGVGGSVALYGRVFTEFIGRHIPGNPTIVFVSMPGAGGVNAVEFITNIAPQDGTVIG